MELTFINMIIALLILWVSNRVVAFPVPFGISELNEEDTGMLADNYNNLEQGIIPTTLYVKFIKPAQLAPQDDISSENSEIDNIPIKEHATDKPNVVKERSFVYLNQKYKTPIQKQVTKQDLRMQAVNINRNVKSWTKSQFAKFPKYPAKMTSFFQPSLYQIAGPEIRQMEFYNGVNENKVKNKETNHYASDINIDLQGKQRNYLELSNPANRRPYNKKEYEKIDNLQNNKNSLPASQFNDDASIRDDGNEIFDGYENPIQDIDVVTYRPQLMSDVNEDFTNEQTNTKVFFNKEDPSSKFGIGHTDCNQPHCMSNKHFRGKHYSKTTLRKPHKPGCDCNHKKIFDNKHKTERIERGRKLNHIMPSGHKCQNDHQESTSDSLIENELQNSVNILNRTLQMYR